MRSRIRDHLDVVLLIVVSVGIQALYLHFASRDPVYGLGTVDQQYYLGWGGRIADGHLGGDNPFRTPLYPYLIAAIFGIARTRDPVVIQIVQIAAATASLVLVRRLGCLLFGRVAGTTSAFLLLAYWPWVHTTCEIETEPSFILLTLCFLNLLLLKAGGFPSARRLTLAGAVLSAAILDRPNGSLLLVPALAWLLLRPPEGRRPRLVAAGWILAGMIPLLGINAVRNGVNAGRPIPVSDQAGVNFYVGNRPGASGYSARLPGLRADWLYPELESFTESEVGRRLEYAEVIAYWRRRAADLVVAQPAIVAGNLWKKTLLFLNHYEIGNNRELYQFRRTNPVLRVLPITFPVLLALGTAGLFYLRRNLDEGLLVVAPFALLAAGVVAFFVCSRYRLPAIPFLALLGGAGCTGLVSDIRNRSGRRSAAALAAAALAFLVSAREVYGLNERAFAYEREFSLGVLAAQRGDARSAAQHFEAVVAAKPSFVEAGINLANIYRDNGRWDEALQIYRRVEREGGRSFLPIVLLDEGLLYRKRGDYSGAVAAYSRYLEVRPDAPEGLAHLTICRLADGRVDEAVRTFQRGASTGGERYVRLLGRSVLPSEARPIRAALSADATLTADDEAALLRVLFPRSRGER